MVWRDCACVRACVLDGLSCGCGGDCMVVVIVVVNSFNVLVVVMGARGCLVVDTGVVLLHGDIGRLVMVVMTVYSSGGGEGTCVWLSGGDTVVVLLYGNWNTGDCGDDRLVVVVVVVMRWVRVYGCLVRIL